MTGRQQILAGIRAALDDLAAGEDRTYWQQAGVTHMKSFTKFDSWEGRGRVVHAWLGPETNVDETDSPEIAGMAVTIMVWGKLCVDGSIVEDEVEKMIADLKRALLIMDDTGYTALSSHQTSIKSVTPDVVDGSTGHVIVEATVTYYNNMRTPE